MSPQKIEKAAGILQFICFVRGENFFELWAITKRFFNVLVFVNSLSSLQRTYYPLPLVNNKKTRFNCCTFLKKLYHGFVNNDYKVVKEF